MEDIEVTKRLAEAGKIIGIEVLDHLIVSHTGKYVSLKEKGYNNKKKDEQEGDDSPFCFLGTEYLWKALKETTNKRRHTGWIVSWCVHAWRKNIFFSI
ncbi:hypothetical protein J7J00_26720 [Bacillus sp. ISL-4]|nr:hypothetical protein [Bacillus sp. ISL-4]MBT2671328.1 hypothetical protein [Streptomyces sp. ISL-14]